MYHTVSSLCCPVAINSSTVIPVRGGSRETSSAVPLLSRGERAIDLEELRLGEAVSGAGVSIITGIDVSENSSATVRHRN